MTRSLGKRPIRNVAAVLAPDGVLFGGTVLGSSEQHTPLARAILWAFNRRGVFDNLADTEEGLREILEESFQTVEIDVVGSILTLRPTARTDPPTIGLRLKPRRSPVDDVGGAAG